MLVVVWCVCACLAGSANAAEWTLLPQNPSECFLDVRLAGEEIVASSWGGQLFRWNGAAWSPERVAPGFEWLHAMSADGRFVAGSDGNLYRKAARGWETAYSGENVGFLDVEARGERIWAVGTDGVVVRSADGGGSWDRSQPAAGTILQGLAFRSDTDGLAVGVGGIVLHTVDGGATWATRLTPTEAILNGVAFLDDAFAFAVGRGGVVLSTNDGGQRWGAVQPGVKTELSAVAAIDAKTVAVAGAKGVVRISDDYGLTWRKADLPDDRWIHALASDGETLYAAGIRGSVWTLSLSESPE